MRLIEGFEFFPLTFNDEGRLESGQESAALLERASSAPASDAIFLAHGFRNDVSDATNLYTRFLTTFRAHLARPEFQGLTARRFVVVGVYWPSKPFRESFDNTPAGTRGLGADRQAMATAATQLEELKADASPSEAKKLDKAIRLLPALEGNPAKQDEFVALVLSVIDDADDDQTEGLPRIRQRPGSELLARLSLPAGDGTTRHWRCARRDRRWRRPVSEPDALVRHEGPVRQGRRHRRGCGRACAPRSRARPSAFISWDTVLAAG